jgi:hypothetical protein
MINTNEIVLYKDHNIDDFRPPFTESSIRPSRPLNSYQSTPTQRSALETCVASAHTVLEIFVSLPLSSARAIPGFTFIRCAYACIVLVKIYFSPNVHIDKSSLQVAEYLDKLIRKLEITGQDGRSRGAGKFAMILGMVKGWYIRQKAEFEAMCGFKRLEIGGPDVDHGVGVSVGVGAGIDVEREVVEQVVESVEHMVELEQQEWSGMVFTGSGEMFRDDSFWALIDGGWGWGGNTLDWGGF